MSIFIKTGLWESRKDTDAPKGWLNLSKYISNNSGGGGGSQSIRLTRTEILALQASSSFIIGANYTITDADVNLYGGTEITLTAITSNELSLQGSGKFYCPKYDVSAESTGYEIWTKQMEGTFSNIVGTFTQGETVTSNDGSTAIYLAEGFLEWISGSWNLATSISGATATADVLGFLAPGYEVDQIVHWGGKSWISISGRTGSSIDKYTLDSEWQEIPFNETDYNVYIDEIQYDFDNDMIIYRKDRYNNVVSGSNQVFVEFEHPDGFGYGNPIKDFQWGCAQDNFNTDDYFRIGIQGNEVIDSYFETLNTRGKYIWFNKLSQFSYIKNTTLNNSSSISNTTFSGISFTENITFSNSSIEHNTLSNGSNIKSTTLSNNSYINYNTLSNSYIQNNNLSFSSISKTILSNYSYIDNNTLSGNSNVYNNTLSNGSYIQNNTLSGGSSIQNNTLINGSSIRVNTLNSNNNITSNTLSNESNIQNNSLSSYGDIVSNTLSNSFINSNTLSNSSHINSNTLSNGGIFLNILSNNNYINTNALNNSYFRFSNFVNVIRCNANYFNVNNNTIDLLGATIISSNHSKDLFNRQDDTPKLSYVNNSDVVVITNVNT